MMSLLKTGLSIGNNNKSSTRFGQSLGLPTITDTFTTASGISTWFIANYIPQPTIAALNSGVTTTNAATLYIENSPLAGTNETITNPYSLYIAAGTAYFGGGLLMNNRSFTNVGSTTPSGATLAVVSTSTTVNPANNYYYSYLAQPATTGITSGTASTLYIEGDSPSTTYTSPSYVSFTRNTTTPANSHFMSNANITFNTQTNGGFTVLTYVRFTGNVGSYERIFDFGKGQSNYNLLIARSVTNPTIVFSMYVSSTPNEMDNVGTITQGVWTVIVGRYTHANLQMQLYQDGVLLGTKTTDVAYGNQVLTSNYIGRSNWGGDDYSNMDVMGLIAYDRALTDAEILTCTNIVKGLGGNIPATPVVQFISSDIATLATLDTRKLSSWGSPAFTQDTAVNQPLYVPRQQNSGKIQTIVGGFNIPQQLSYGVANYVSFNAASSQHMSSGTTSFNTQTNGGFTAVAYVRLTGAIVSWARIFDFGFGQGNYNILLARNGNSTTAAFYMGYDASSNSNTASGGTITIDAWTLLVGRYQHSDRSMQLYQDGVLVGTATLAVAYGDRALTLNYVARSNWAGDSYPNVDIAGLVVYDRRLSDVEVALCSNIVTGATDKTLLPDIPKYTLLNTNLSQTDNTGVATWGEFSQGTSANQPLFRNLLRFTPLNNNLSAIFPTTANVYPMYNATTQRWLIGSNGTTNTLCYSDDGINWVGLGNTVFDSANGSLKSMTNGNTWVAVGGTTNTLAVSTNNGITWTGKGTSNLTFGRNIGWSPYDGASGRWIAVGQLSGVGTIAYSDNNGSTWTSLTFSAICIGVNPSEIYGIQYNSTGRVWVCGFQISNGYTIAYSINGGMNWTATQQNLFTSYCYNIGWNGSLWVAVGSSTGNTIATSTDGISWVGRADPIGDIVRDIAWTGTYWIAAGEPSGTNPSIAYSSNGSTWTILSGSYYSINKVISAASIINPASETTYPNYALNSASGTNYFGGNITIGGALTSAAYQKAFTINQKVYGQTLKRYTIPHDKTTYLKTSNISAILTGYPNTQQVFTFGQSVPNMWVAGGNGTNTLAYSTDGLNWIGLGTNIFGTAGFSITYNGIMWLAGGTGTNTIAYSFDGITWTGLGTTIFTSECGAIAWNGTLWVAVGTLTGSTIKYSYDGITWINASGSTFNTKGWGVAWNGLIWVAVGQDTSVDINKKLLYSYDGINWYVSSGTIFTTYGLSVAWNGTIWIATGGNTLNSNRIMYSYDGINWENSINGNSILSGTNAYGYTVSWNGLLWVVIGVGRDPSLPRIVYSYNGLNWTTGDTSTLFDEQGICTIWDGTKFIAGGQFTSVSTTSTLAYSYNGINWVGLGRNLFTTYCHGLCVNMRRPHTITFPRNLIVAGGGTGGNSLMYSTDGITWTNSATGTAIFTSGYCNTVAWNGSIWVAGGTGTSPLAYSTDGMTWNTINSGLLTICRGVAWNGIMWIAVGAGASNTIIYSYDGLIWMGLGAAIFTTSGYCIAWNGSIWITGGAGGNSLAYSSNGRDWTGLGAPSTSTFSTSCNGLAWNGTIWVAVGESTDAKIKYSYNGQTWSTAIAAPSNAIFNTRGNSVAWNGSHWVAGGTDTSGAVSCYSYNGITWINSNLVMSTPVGFYQVIPNAPMNTTYNWRSITSNTDGYKLAACAENNYIYTSTDGGVTWIQQTNSGSRAWYSIASSSDGTKLAACEYAGYIYTSTDSGVTWTQQNNSGSSVWTSIASDSTGQYLVACAYSGYIYTSTDSGVNWTGRLTDATRAWTGVTSSSNGQYLAACETGGYIYTSTNYGSGWTPRSNAGLRSWQCIASNSSNGQNLVAGDWGGSLYVSINGGASWSAQFTDYGRTWSSATLSSTGSIMTACSYGENIYTSTNSGSSWTQVSNNAFNWWSITSSSNGLNIATAVLGGYIYTNGYENKPSLNSVIWMGQRWVATSNDFIPANCILYSQDGINWNSSSGAAFSTQGNACAWNAGTGSAYIQHPMIALGAGLHTIAYSPDGLQWRGLGARIFSIVGFHAAWNGSIWVAGGQGTNTLAWSQDGITWTGLGTSIFTTWCHWVAWNGSLWVAVGSGTNTIAWSTDGKTWTAVSADLGGSLLTDGYTVVWNGTIWAAVGMDTGNLNFIISSTNGKVWIGQGKAGFTTGIATICWVGSRWIIGGQGGVTNQLIQYSSSTGLSGWTNPTTTPIFGTVCTSIAWNGTRLVAVGSVNNTIAYSDDNGVTWTVLGTSIFSTVGRKVAWNGRAFVAGGAGTNSLAYSGNGANWSAVPNNSSIFPVANGCYGIGTNPRIGATVVDSQLVLNPNGYGQNDNLDIISDTYFDKSITNFSASIKYT